MSQPSAYQKQATLMQQKEDVDLDTGDTPDQVGLRIRITAPWLLVVLALFGLIPSCLGAIMQINIDWGHFLCFHFLPVFFTYVSAYYASYYARNQIVEKLRTIAKNKEKDLKETLRLWGEDEEKRLDREVIEKQQRLDKEAADEQQQRLDKEAVEEQRRIKCPEYLLHIYESLWHSKDDIFDKKLGSKSAIEQLLQEQTKENATQVSRLLREEEVPLKEKAPFERKALINFLTAHPECGSYGAGEAKESSDETPQEEK